MSLLLQAPTFLTELVPENTFESVLHCANINNKLRTWENSISFTMYSDKPGVMYIRIINRNTGSKEGRKEKESSEQTYQVMLSREMNNGVYCHSKGTKSL